MTASNQKSNVSAYHWLCLKADTHRLCGNYSLSVLLKGLLLIRTFRVIALIRICKIIDAAPVYWRWLLPFAKIFHRMATRRAGIDFSWRTEIGPGLSIAHGWGIVVNEDARIGSNVTLLHGVTLGRSDHINPEGTRESCFPTVGNDVWIGPNALIIGGVTIGDGCRVAGGAFVNKSLTAYSLVIGNPFVVAKTNCIPDVLNRVEL